MLTCSKCDGTGYLRCRDADCDWDMCVPCFMCDSSGVSRVDQLERELKQTKEDAAFWQKKHKEDCGTYGDLFSRFEELKIKYNILLDDCGMACENPCGTCCGCQYAQERADRETL